MENEIKIKRAINGFIVTVPEEWEDGTFHKTQKVFADGDVTSENEEDELTALKWALVEVKEQLGYFYSKHNKINLIIETKKENEDNN
jgi:hypothetical protein